MSSSETLRLLADELGEIAATVAGVRRVHARPGVGRLARRVLEGIGGAVSSSPASPMPDVALTVTDASTLVEVDVVIDPGHSGPVVARGVAASILDRLAAEALPQATVDVRIVAVVA